MKFTRTFDFHQNIIETVVFTKIFNENFVYITSYKRLRSRNFVLTKTIIDETYFYRKDHRKKNVFRESWRTSFLFIITLLLFLERI
jgi:hypothetical protein